MTEDESNYMLIVELCALWKQHSKGEIADAQFCAETIKALKEYGFNEETKFWV